MSPIVGRPKTALFGTTPFWLLLEQLVNYPTEALARVALVTLPTVNGRISTQKSS